MALLKLLSRTFCSKGDVRAMARNIEILRGNSSAEGGICHLYLLGVDHDSEESRQETRSIIRHLRPQALFLELDEYRRQLMMLSNDRLKSEQYVAFEEGMRCGSNIIYGDMEEEPMWKRIDELTIAKTKSEPQMEYSECREEAIMQVVHHERDEYMITRLMTISRNSSSVLAILGNAHLPGMTSIWNERIGGV